MPNLFFLISDQIWGRHNLELEEICSLTEDRVMETGEPTFGHLFNQNDKWEAYKYKEYSAHK